MPEWHGAVCVTVHHGMMVRRRAACADLSCPVRCCAVLCCSVLSSAGRKLFKICQVCICNLLYYLFSCPSMHTMPLWCVTGPGCLSHDINASKCSISSILQGPAGVLACFQSQWSRLWDNMRAVACDRHTMCRCRGGSPPLYGLPWLGLA